MPHKPPTVEARAVMIMAALRISQNSYNRARMVFTTTYREALEGQLRAANYDPRWAGLIALGMNRFGDVNTWCRTVLAADDGE